MSSRPLVRRRLSVFASLLGLGIFLSAAYTNCGRAQLGGGEIFGSVTNGGQSVNVTVTACGVGKVAIGLDASSSLICAPVVSVAGSKCAAGSSVYLSNDASVSCVTNTSWDQAGNVCRPVGSFLLSYSTTGGLECGYPTTTSTNLAEARCPVGQYLNGIDAGKAVCLPIPVAIPTSAACPVGNVLTGFLNGKATCTPVPWSTSFPSASCPSDSFALGFVDGKLLCRQSVFPTLAADAACPQGQVLASVTNGSLVCSAPPNPDLSFACRAGYKVASVGQGLVACAPLAAGAIECSLGQFVTGIRNAQPVCSDLAPPNLPGTCPRSTYPLAVANGQVVCAGFDGLRYPSSASLCFPGDSTLCALVGGSGHQTCAGSGSAWSSCAADRCDAGYELVGSACKALACQPGITQTCALDHGTGQQSCDVHGTWTACQAVACDENFFINKNACAAKACSSGASLACADGPGLGSRACLADGSGYGSCAINACQTGYTLKDGACVDTSAPRITFTAPANPVKGHTLKLVFAAVDPESGVAGVACWLDDAKLANCASPVTLSGLKSGAHVFKVSAKDTTGNVANEQLTFNVDACEAGQAQQCSLAHGVGQQMCGTDGTYAAACLPVTCEAGYKTDGTQCLSLNCGDGFSAVGNACVDNLPPKLAITSAPASPLIAIAPVVQFTAADPGSGLALVTCQLDAQAPVACASPYQIGNVGVGSHQLVILAKDTSGNVAKATASWQQFNCSPGARVSCAIPNGQGAQTCAADGSAFGACAVTTCQDQFTAQGNTCVAVPPVSVIADLKWSHAGAISGMKCTQITEPTDPHTWTDNFLCGTKDWGFRWSSSGPIAGMSCLLINEPSDSHSWQDNYLCAPKDLGLKWSHAGPIAGLKCVQIDEPADPDTWVDNYLCGK